MLSECCLCQKCGHIHLTLDYDRAKDAKDSGCLDRGWRVLGRKQLAGDFQPHPPSPLPHPQRSSHTMRLVPLACIQRGLAGLGGTGLTFLCPPPVEYPGDYRLVDIPTSLGSQGGREPGAVAPSSTRDNWAGAEPCTVHGVLSFSKQRSSQGRDGCL